MDTAKVIKISEPLLPGPHRGVEKPPGVKRLARHRPECGSARQRQGQRRCRGRNDGPSERQCRAGHAVRPERGSALRKRQRRRRGRGSRRRTDPRGRGRNDGPSERQCRAGHAVRPERGSALRKRQRRRRGRGSRRRTDPRGRGRGGEGDRCELKARIEPQAQGFRVKFVSLSGLSLRRRWTFRKK